MSKATIPCPKCRKDAVVNVPSFCVGVPGAVVMDDCQECVAKEPIPAGRRPPSLANDPVGVLYVIASGDESAKAAMEWFGRLDPEVKDLWLGTPVLVELLKQAAEFSKNPVPGEPELYSLTKLWEAAGSPAGNGPAKEYDRLMLIDEKGTRHHCFAYVEDLGDGDIRVDWGTALHYSMSVGRSGRQIGDRRLSSVLPH